VGAKVVAMISSGGAIAVTAANQGVPFVLSHRESQLYRDVMSLVKVLVPQNMLLGEEEEQFDLDLETPTTLPERIRQAPTRLRLAAAEGVKNLRTSDMLMGLGTLFAVSAPFILIFAIVGFLARAMTQSSSGGPAFGLAFNASIWVGIVGGTFLLERLQPEPRRSAWVLGAVLGAAYGLTMSFSAIAIGNVTGATVNTPVIGLILNAIPYALFGIAGTMIADRTRPQAQALLG
jgi:hypothetical protein